MQNEFAPGAADCVLPPTAELWDLCTRAMRATERQKRVCLRLCLCLFVSVFVSVCARVKVVVAFALD